MLIFLENRSSVLNDAEVKAALPALREYSYHLRLAWGTAVATLHFGKPPKESWQILILDDSDEPGALGYHDFTPGGKPITKVFVKTDQKYGLSWTVTLTHELAEMLCDPYVMRCEQTGNAQFHALEVCDPCEADKFAYELDGVLVSDFITPAWFQPEGEGLFDRCGHIKEPLQVLEGGYAYVWKNGDWYAVDAQGQRKTASELPDRDRLQKYSRER